MAKVELIMPKMGESIMEATIIKWVKNVGDTVDMDETILEIATDKVDSEIPSPVAGTVAEILFKEDDVVEVGKVIAIIATEGEEVSPSPAVADPAPKPEPAASVVIEERNIPFVPSPAPSEVAVASDTKGTRFYSPLVKSIAKQENISVTELGSISGSGANGRVTKKDVLGYVNSRSNGSAPVAILSAYYPRLNTK